MEFSAYEIGLPKYGTFMKTEHFGSKYFMGQLVRKHPEPPLHFLQGRKTHTLVFVDCTRTYGCCINVYHARQANHMCEMA